MNKICLKWNSVFTVGKSKKKRIRNKWKRNTYFTADKNNKRNLHISPRSSLTAGLILMN